MLNAFLADRERSSRAARRAGIWFGARNEGLHRVLTFAAE